MTMYIPPYNAPAFNKHMVLSDLRREIITLMATGGLTNDESKKLSLGNEVLKNKVLQKEKKALKLYIKNRKLFRGYKNGLNFCTGIDRGLYKGDTLPYFSATFFGHTDYFQAKNKINLEKIIRDKYRCPEINIVKCKKLNIKLN